MGDLGAERYQRVAWGQCRRRMLARLTKGTLPPRHISDSRVGTLPPGDVSASHDGDIGAETYQHAEWGIAARRRQHDSRWDIALLTKSWFELACISCVCACACACLYARLRMRLHAFARVCLRASRALCAHVCLCCVWLSVWASACVCSRSCACPLLVFLCARSHVRMRSLVLVRMRVSRMCAFALALVRFFLCMCLCQRLLCMCACVHVCALAHVLVCARVCSQLGPNATSAQNVVRFMPHRLKVSWGGLSFRLHRVLVRLYLSCCPCVRRMPSAHCHRHTGVWGDACGCRFSLARVGPIGCDSHGCDWAPMVWGGPASH